MADLSRYQGHFDHLLGRTPELARALVEQVQTTLRASSADIALAHDRAYVDQVLSCSVPREIERRIGLPVSESVVRRARASAGWRERGRGRFNSRASCATIR